MFILSDMAQTILKLFTIAIIGYAIGRIRIKGISLGTAAIFLSGLIFGGLGWELPAVLQNIGLVLFITSVGFSAGPGFIDRLKKNGLRYAFICIFTAAIGSLLCAVIIKQLKVDTPLAVGIMTGAFTTSPGLAAAKEAVSVSAQSVEQVAAGYGMAYPVGIICKVIFIQLIPKVLKVDMEEERQKIKLPSIEKNNKMRKAFRFDRMGVFSFGVAVIIGIIVGSIQIPLPSGGSFALGMTGGPLIISLLFGYFGRCGNLDLCCSKKAIAPFKEIGLLLFFSGAGVEGGRAIPDIFSEYSVIPMILSLVIVCVCMLSGFFVSYRVCKLPMLNGLGAMTASMTCTPSLAVLTDMAGTDDVVAAYATTYPIALVTLVIVVQMLVKL